MDKYLHVLEARRHLVEAEADVRISAVHEDVWINYPLADHILRLVGTLLKLPSKTQAPCLLVHGDPGMGKTTLFQKITMRYGFSTEADSRIATLSLAEEYPETSKSFAELVIRALTAGNFNNPKLPDQVLINSIRELKIKALAIDELNDMLLCSSLDVRKNIKLLKKLSGAPFGLPIVGLGTDECQSVLAYEKQMMRRFSRIHLTPWVESEQLRSFLASYESTLPLRLPSSLASEKSVKFLVRESTGILDDMVKMISNAATLAIIEGVERITLDILKRSKTLPVY